MFFKESKKSDFFFAYVFKGKYYNENRRTRP